MQNTANLAVPDVDGEKEYTEDGLIARPDNTGAIGG